MVSKRTKLSLSAAFLALTVVGVYVSRFGHWQMIEADGMVIDYPFMLVGTSNEIYSYFKAQDPRNRL